MEVFTCSSVQYTEKSCHPQEKSIMEFMHNGESNCVEYKQVSLEENKGDDTVSHLEETVNGSLENGLEPDGEVLALERTNIVSSCCEIDENDQKSGGHHDQEDDNLDEHGKYKETCLDFQNSHVVVDTIQREPLWDNKEEDLQASQWPEHDEALALWVKWRGQWQAGIKCARADWPLETVRAKPTHARKNYIVIFFPHSRNYSWVDTQLVCSIDEFPQPIAHRSREVGVQLVEDLTVARRFIMKKLVIGVLNVVDQLPIKVLAEAARDMAVWREFALEASGCKGYPDLGRLLLKFQNMLMQQFIDGSWLQNSLDQWTEKCQRAVSADTIEILKDEFVESILWNEVNSLRDAQGQPGFGSEWKMWKHDALKCFPSSSGGGDVDQSSKDGVELQGLDSPLTTSLLINHKRPKLEVRRAEQHTLQVENKSSHDNTVHLIDSSFPAVQSSISNDNPALGTPKEELQMEGTVPVMSPANDVDRWDDVTVSYTNIESAPSISVELQPNGVEETKSLTSKYRSRQCVAFVECKGRRCGRWANEGDDYCCVHGPSRFPKTTIQTVVTSADDTPMCQGTTNSGARCKHRSLPGSSFCKKHRSRGDCVTSPSSPGSQLKRKLDVLLEKSEYNSCKDIVVFGEAQRPPEEQLVKVTITEDITFNGGNSSSRMPEHSEDTNAKIIEVPFCIGLGVNEAGALCLETPNRHSLYCEKHVPSWLKRARNGKSRIISKEVFLNLWKECSTQREKVYLHQACELFYKLFKSVLSARNQVPKEIQFQWIMSEATKDSHVAEFLMKLVCSEKERLRRIWGFDVSKDTIVSSSPLEEQAIVPVKECYFDGTWKCKICSEDFSDDQTLGAHWIKNHNKEAQWLFRGYACAICLDSFTNKKVLETHVQERHHAQFVEHCMLIQCIPCGSHFGNSDELWSHVLSVHTEGFRQSKAGAPCHLIVSSHQKNVSSNAASTGNNSESQSTTRKFVCRFCGLKFDLLPDLGRHHQAAHMGASLLGSRPKKKGLSFYSYRLKSGRLSRPRFKKGLSGASYRLGNKGGIMLKKRIQSVNALGGGGITVQSHVMDTARLIRLTESQCWDIAKILWSEARKTKARPNNHEIISIARSACCKVSLQKTLEQKYGSMPERLYLRAAKLCSDNNIQVAWHQEGFHCLNGCKLIDDQMLVPVLSSVPNDHTRVRVPSSDPQPGEWEKDECHYVINSCHLRHQSLKTTIILCDDISFGQETVPVSCVVDKNLLSSLHVPTVDFDGRVVFMPWDSFTYVAKPHLDQSFHVNMQYLQLGCGCEGTTCSPETCDHVYLFNTDFENAKGLDGKPMEGRFAYDNHGRIIVEAGCLVYECNHLCKCSRNCPNRVLQNGVKVKLEVFRKEKGWGVRAGETILRGTFVCEFVGEVLDVQEADKRRQRYGEEGHSYFYDVGPHLQRMSDLMEGHTKYVVDGTKYGNVSRFVNHSSSANLVSHLVLVESMDFKLAHVGLYAKQDISAGEELTIDYRYQLQSREGCPCSCEAPNCRCH